MDRWMKGRWEYCIASEMEGKADGSDDGWMDG